MADSTIRIGFVPEHFSTPLHFAEKHFGLDAKLIPFPSGTGHMRYVLKPVAPALSSSVGSNTICLTELTITAVCKSEARKKRSHLST